MEDKEIVELYLNMSKNAIYETEKKYFFYLSTIAYNILHDDNMVKECEKDTYIRAGESIPIDKPENLKVYLSKLIRDISVSRLRSNMTKKEERR